MRGAGIRTRLTTMATITPMNTNTTTGRIMITHTTMAMTLRTTMTTAITAPMDTNID